MEIVNLFAFDVVATSAEVDAHAYFILWLRLCTSTGRDNHEEYYIAEHDLKIPKSQEV